MSAERSPLSLQTAHPLRSLNQFFHSEEVPYGMALVRIVLPWALFAAHARRWVFGRELFSLDGAPAPLWINYDTLKNIPLFSGTTITALHTLLLLCLVAISLGWRTRLSCVIAAVIFTYTNMADSIGTLAKYTCIGTHSLLILAMSRCGDVWSIDAWVKGFNKKKIPWPGEPTADWPRSSVWARRLLQLSLAAVYFGAAITKLKTPGFVSGDQLIAWLLTNTTFDKFLGEWVAMNPTLLVVVAYATIFWEILFPFAVWRGFGRMFMLSIGLAFHLSTLLMLGLTTFPAVCAPLYFAFLDERDYQILFSFCRKVRRKHSAIFARLRFSLPRLAWPAALRMPSAAAFGLTMLFGSAAGVLAEHLYDPYGIRRPEGPYTLKELDPEFVAELTRPAPPLQDKDVFFTFDVGSIFAGGVLLDQRETFRFGETMRAQFFAVMPHEDMWVECNLHDTDDRVVDRVPLILSREATRGTFNFQVSKAFTPGDYYLVLKRGATEISRRKVTFLPEEQAEVRAAVAN